MKFVIDLPPEKVKFIYELTKEWKEKSDKPLTYCERLSQLEKEIALQLTYTILQANDLERLKEEIEQLKKEAA